MMKKSLVIFALVLLIGCSNLSAECKQECSKYDDSETISSLLGITVGKPKDVICIEPLDCKAKYEVSDTSFDLYYFQNDSTGDFEKEWNHEVLYVSNCEGELCDSLNEFHYSGKPRELDIVCKNDKMVLNTEGEIEEYDVDCEVLNIHNKYFQRTWPCDYRTLIEESCS